ncbi:MAG: hypothetical protein COB62_03535 [Piscirickettsiaceae bacterium]|nr:MAG: hypothetical protein COB62_03535 [Piscirickettsiaceae bacterium]
MENLAIIGDLAPLRDILYSSKVSKKTKNHIKELSDDEFREDFLKRINFDCKEASLKNIKAFLRSQLSKRVIDRGGLDSQVENCLNEIVVTLLNKAIKSEKTERIAYKSDLEALIERATRVSLNTSKLEHTIIEMMRGLSVPSSQTTNLVSSRLSEPKPIDKIPLPEVIATRNHQVDNIILSLTHYGICWVFGSAGVGKTTGVRIVGKNLGGNWTIINLRGLNTDQANSVLSGVIDVLMEQRIKGLIIDDLECVFESGINDTLLYLKTATERADVLLIITSPRPPDTDFLFSSGLTSAINQKFEEFSEEDIQQILTGLNVDYKNWTRYIYLISGCGHPQLAIAAIQSMHDNGWDINALEVTDSLLVGNQEVEKVRARTRERLLSELPNKARRLLERLSLKIGGFNRELVKDLAQIAPAIEDGGIIFDRLIGSWIDQQESNRFSLSPLLSNFANKTLTANQQKEISFEIASSFLRIKSLNPIEANSALMSALSGKNTSAIFFICSAIMNADEKDLKMIVPYFTAVTFMTTESLVYEGNPIINLTCRVAQLLLLRYEEDSQGTFQKALNRFYIESELIEDKQISTLMAVLAYAKLLFSKSENGPLQNYYNLIRKYDYLVNTSIKTLPDLLKDLTLQEVNGLPVVSVMFQYQSQQIKTINGLLATFKFLDLCDQEFRQKLLKIYGDSELGIDFDMLVSGAWLSENDANSIDPSAHALVFQQLEDFANAWGYIRLAVCCRKFRAIILDEYGNDQTQALKVLDEGLNFYDKTNSVLIRAKAKVLYRAEDHQGSLELAKLLIDKCVPLNQTEQAFLGRDAAISSEKQGEYIDARRYYLYGSNGAKNCLDPSMEPMRLGLITDAALASWHAGDRVTCLNDLVAVLHELKKVDPQSSLRATHCHATARHVFLWLYQDASGREMLLNDGEETRITPGIVSNPDPHPDIKKQDIAPIEMTWYLLASIENECHLDLGITKNLHQYLPKGPALEGQFFLTISVMSNALTCADIELFKATLPLVITQYAYLFERGEALDIKNITYGTFPELTTEQQLNYMGLTEKFVLCFIFMCIFLERPNLVNLLLNFLEKSKLIKVRNIFLSNLQNKSISSSDDYSNQVAMLLGHHLKTPQEFKAPSPNRVYTLAYHSIQLAHEVGYIRDIAETINKWVIKHWAIFMQDPHFRLRFSPSHENQIKCASSEGDSSEKLINLMLEILPMLGLNNENQIRADLTSLSSNK